MDKVIKYKSSTKLYCFCYTGEISPRRGKSISPIDTVPETCFYTMNAYHLAAKVTKPRYTLLGVLLSLTASAVMSLLLARGMG